MPVEALRGVPWTLLTYAATRVVTLATTLVLARLLAPEDFGLFAMAILGMEVLSVFSGLWLAAALIVRPDMDRRAQGTVLTLVLAAGSLLAVALLAASPAIAAFFGEPRLRELVMLLAAVLVVSGVNWFYETVLQRELAFRRRFAGQVVRTVAFSIVALELALLGAGPWSLPVAYLCGHLAHGVVLLVLAPYLVRPAFDREEARRVVRGGRGFLEQDLATFLIQNADYLAVGRILGPAPLGFYAMAYRQAELPHYAIAEPVAKVTFPAFAQMRHRGEDVRPAFVNALRLIALATCPIGIVLSAAAVPFTVALFGEQWRPMAAPLSVLGIWAVMRPLQTTVGYLLNSFARAEIYGRVATISLVPFVPATFVGASLGGIKAVAWVLLAHMTATFAVLTVLASRCAGVPVREQARALWPLAVASAASWMVTSVVVTAADELPAALALAAAVAGCLVSYLGALGILAPGLLTAAARDVRRAVGRPPREAAARAPREAAAHPPRFRTSVPALAIAAAVGVGALVAVDPKLAVALVGGALLMTLPFVIPVTHLVLLLLVTAIVPFSMLNAFGLGGGVGTPGLLVCDVLMLGGLARASLVLLDTPLERRPKLALLVVAVFLVVAAGQLVHGLRLGYDAGTAGTEFRALLGFAAAVIALPLLADPVARERLFKGLIVVGLATGVWGIAQWTLDIPFVASGDAGVREGVRFTTEGRGQIQGGLFAFPVAVVMSVAALMSHELRSAGTRALLAAIAGLNAIDLLLTYERTLWVATLLALAVLGLKAAPEQRLRALALGPALVMLVVAGMAVVVPRDLTAARERLVSLGEYGTDRSVRYRVTETRHVTGEISARPVLGSGLGATILWGRAYDGVQPATESYAHNGYLWLAWKLGAPGAALLVLLLVAAALLRGPPTTTTTLSALRVGAQTGLLVLLVASITFAAFNALAITAVMGVLLAICFAPQRMLGSDFAQEGAS